MRTAEEIIRFMETNKISSKEAHKHVPLGVRALMPQEEVLFAFCGNQNSKGIESQGIHAYLATEKRLIVAQAPVLFQKGNLCGVEFYTWEQIGGISYTKGFLTGTITIYFPTTVGNIMVEKKGTELIFQQLTAIQTQSR